MQIIAACLQKSAEGRVRKDKPNRFPPTMGTFIRSAYRTWKEEVRSGQHGKYAIDNVCCGENSFVSHVRAELGKFNRAKAKYEQKHGKSTTGLLTGIDRRGFRRKTTVVAAVNGRMSRVLGFTRDSRCSKVAVPDSRESKAAATEPTAPPDKEHLRETLLQVRRLTFAADVDVAAV